MAAPSIPAALPSRLIVPKWSTGACLVALWLGSFAPPARGGESEAPFCRVYDTGTPAAAAPAPSVVEERRGWARVEEGDRTHAFTGDAAVTNDRLAVVVGRTTPSVWVYSRSAGGLARRAALAPVAAEPLRETAAVRITTNGPAAVVIETACKTKAGREVALRCRLTTGAMFLELQPGDGVRALRIDHAPRFVVVPDFFADDVVLDAAADDRAGLPAENQVLGLVGDGDAMVMTLWSSSGQGAGMVVDSGPGGRSIRGIEVECATGRKVWVACLEGHGIWHHRAATGSAWPAPLDWTPPFPARWRLDAIGPGGLSRSQAYSPGTAVRPDAKTTGLVVYPLDRDRATPLTTFCPVDVMRSTLGCGPCEYVLEMEGFGSEAHPTPASVADWVDAQFRRGREKRDADAIRERLDRMVEHVGHVDERIADYLAFGRKVQQLCAANANPSVEALVIIAKDLEQRLDETRAQRDPAIAAREAEAVVALIGQPEPSGACGEACTRLRALGGAQDRALAAGRMAARRLKQHCRSVSDDANVTAIARLAEDILKRK